MKKYLAVILILSLFLLLLAACSNEYQAEDFIGKDSAQIEAEFGPFDCCGSPAGSDGLFRNTACGYTIKASRVGFLGTEPEWLFFIQFDENGVADGTYEGYRPGG